MTKIFGRNVHPVERIGRVVVGIGLLTVGVLGITPWGFAGIVPLVTGLAGNCPLYGLLGFSTCPVKR